MVTVPESETGKIHFHTSRAITWTSKPSSSLRAEGEEPRSGVSWVGRWSSGDVEFTIRSSIVTWGGGREGKGGRVMQFLLIFTPPYYRLQGRGEGSKRMIRKWIRLSPFPLSHQPGREIQRGNLRRKKTNGSLPKEKLTERREQKRRLVTTQKILREMRVITPLLIQMQT